MKDSPVIALVDDEANMREVVAHALKKEGYTVEAYRDGQEAWTAIEGSLPDMVILDIIMPRMDGLELCRRIRAVSAGIPLIFLTSRDDEFDRVLGLELGADDYLCKPFSIRELIARIRVLFRRISMDREARIPVDQECVRCGPLALDLLRFTAAWNDVSVPFTVTEFRILLTLVEIPGVVFSREQLIRKAYPEDAYVSDRSVDTHIKRIRQKIMELDSAFDDIETVYGLGYRYRVP